MASDTRADYGERRALILTAAVDLFSTRPYEDVSVDDVCQRAGVAHGLVSYHFGGKRGLFAAAVESVARELLAQGRPLEKEVTPSTRLRGSLSRRALFAHEHPEKVALLKARARDPDIAEYLTSVRQESFEQWTEIMGCVGHLLDSEELHVALTAWGAWIDSTLYDGAATTKLDVEYLVDLCVEGLITAIRVARGARSDAEAEFDALQIVMREVAPVPALALA